MMQAEPGASSVLDPPRRGRKKNPDPVVEAPATEIKVPSSMKGVASSGLSPAGDAVSPTKPKRTRHVGEPKPKQYVVGEPETEHNA